jgi:iron complex transport system permease protein
MANHVNDITLNNTGGYNDRFDFAEDRKRIFLFFLFGLLLIAGFISIISGAYRISVCDVCNVFIAHLNPFGDLEKINKLHNTIIWDLRLPRVILSVSVGIALSASGAVFQGCFKNPIVEPYILGISSGAAFGAALGIVFTKFYLSIQASAFIFGLMAVSTAYLLARVKGETPVVTLVLAGIITGSIFMAMVSLLKYMAQDSALKEIVFWIMGGFYYATWSDIFVIFPVVVLGFLITWNLGWELNILSMGDEEATSLGISAEKYKLILILLATLITAVAVSLAGIIAWVGLMMPHASRMILGPDHRYVIPASALLGAIYLIVCDTLARTLTTAEIPISIITSLLGAPYLFYLLKTKGRAIYS